MNPIANLVLGAIGGAFATELDGSLGRRRKERLLHEGLLLKRPDDVRSAMHQRTNAPLIARSGLDTGLKCVGTLGGRS